jgi:hypothetical protein
MTRADREREHERQIANAVAALVLVGGKPTDDGWWTLRRPDGSSEFATKVSVTSWGHIAIVGDAVDIVFRGADPRCTPIARLRWLAEAYSDYLSSKCLTHDDDLDHRVAISDIDSYLAEEDDSERKAALEEIRAHVAHICAFEDLASEWASLGFERWPGQCVDLDIITARALVRRLVTLLESAP